MDAGIRTGGKIQRRTGPCKFPDDLFDDFLYSKSVFLPLKP